MIKKVSKYLICAVLLLAAALFTFRYIIKVPPILADTSFSRTVSDRAGNLLYASLSASESYRVFVPIDKIPDNIINATLMYEDRYFYYHPGVNLVTLARAVIAYTSGADKQFGASTISMQLARMLYKLNTKSISGKLNQIMLALYLELRYPKDDILEAYLNLAPYGHNIEGVEAAALIYFGVNASKLSIIESLSLAVIPQNPVKRTPTNPDGLLAMSEARSRLYSIWLDKYPDDIKYESLFQFDTAVNKPSDLPFTAPHFVNNIFRRSKSDINIRTTLDPVYQSILQQHMDAFIRRNSRVGIKNTSALLLNHKDMKVLAYVGSVDFNNKEIGGQVDGILAPRSPGSVLKPFIFALGLDEGLIHPKSMMKDSPKRFGAYSPENADRGFMGPIFASDALVHSRNIPAIDLLSKLDNSSFYKLLKRSGIKGLRNEEFYGAALAIGGFEATVEDIAKLYAALANFGELKCINYIEGEKCTDSGVKLFTPEAAFLILDILSYNPKPHGANKLGVVSWKTGTSYAYRDAWSAGVFGDYVLIVWVGNFDGLGDPILTGRGAAAPLFFNIISGIAAHDKKSFEKPIPDRILNIASVDICSPTGDLVSRFCPESEQGYFIPGVSPMKVTDIYRQIPINKSTGLRACKYDPEKTVFEVYEFWDSDIFELFKSSGIYKKTPPKYESGCDIDEVSYAGNNPVITSPSNGSEYMVSKTGNTELSFSAYTDSGTKSLYWFLDGRLIKTTAADEQIFWTAVPGDYELSVTDDTGRSATVRFKVLL